MAQICALAFASQSDKLQEQQDLIEELHCLLAHPGMGLLQLTQRPHTAPINSSQQASLGPGHLTPFCNGEAGVSPARQVTTFSLLSKQTVKDYVLLVNKWCNELRVSGSIENIILR